MKYFAIYKKETGELTKLQTCNEVWDPEYSAIIGSTEADEDYCEVDHVGYSYQTAYINVTTKTIVVIPPTPNPKYSFNYITKVWENQRVLSDVQVLQKQLINKSWEQADIDGFMFSEHLIATDPASKGFIDSINGYVTSHNALPNNWVGGWKAADNVFVAITDVTTWQQFYSAMIAQGLSNFTKAQALKTQIMSSTTVEQVETIIW